MPFPPPSKTNPCIWPAAERVPVLVEALAIGVELRGPEHLLERADVRAQVRLRAERGGGVKGKGRERHKGTRERGQEQ